MIRLFVIYLSYLNIDNLLQIKLLRNLQNQNNNHTIVKATNILYNIYIFNLLKEPLAINSMACLV